MNERLHKIITKIVSFDLLSTLSNSLSKLKTDLSPFIIHWIIISALYVCIICKGVQLLMVVSSKLWIFEWSERGKIVVKIDANWWNEFSNVEVRRVRWNDLWNDILGWVKWNELWNDEVWWVRWNNALEQWSTYMRRFQKFLRYTSVSTSCLILDSIFCKNTLVRSIRKKNRLIEVRSAICTP